MLRSGKISIYRCESDDRLTGSQHGRRAKRMPAHISEFISEFGNDFARWNPKRQAKLYIDKAIFEIVDKRAVEGRNIRSCPAFSMLRPPSRTGGSCTQYR
jgi:hypothetical protein